MRLGTNLIRSRHYIYYFRWPVPRILHPERKQTYIKLSLSTRDTKQALRLSSVLEYHAQKLMTETALVNMEYGQVTDLIRNHFAELLAKNKASIYKNGILPPQTVHAIRNTIGLSEHLIKQPDDIIDYYTLTEPQLTKLITEHQLDIPNPSPAYDALRARYLQGNIEFGKQLLRYNEEMEKIDLSTPVVPAISVIPAPASSTLATVIAAFVEEQERANKWGKRAYEERMDCFALLVEILTPDMDAKQFSIEKARAVKDVLQKLPKNRRKAKATKNLNLTDCLNVAGTEKLSIASINKYLTIYGSLGDWATINGYMDKNPFYKMQLTEPKGKKTKKREDFNAKERSIIIAELNKKSDGLANKDHRYWGTLIGIYTGARLNEIASLHLSDIKQDDKIWYFDINDSDATKSLKTDAAYRKVPIHSKLISLGFLGLVEQQKHSGAKRLFPDLPYSAKQGYGRRLGDWFNNRFLPHLGLKSGTKVFHSLRHTAISLMRQSGVDQYIVRDLVGHEAGSVTENYTSGYTLKQLQDAIETISF